MKYLLVALALVLCISITSCSKKDAAVPEITTRTIKVVATGTAPEYYSTIYITKKGETNSTLVDTKTVTTGSYEYTTTLNVGDVMTFDTQTTATSNTLNYTFTKNGVVDGQLTNKEMGMYSKITVVYTVK
jgi:hypothetical protein